MDIRWTRSFTWVVTGPTRCGKRSLWNDSPDMWEIWSPLFPLKSSGVTASGDPLINYCWTKSSLCNGVDQHISSLFTKGSHHRNLSVICIVQNLFDQHKEHCTISLNAYYLVILKKSARRVTDCSFCQAHVSGKTQYVRQAFELSTRQPRGYLVTDLKQVMPEGMWLRSHNFPGENQEVYVENI